MKLCSTTIVCYICGVIQLLSVSPDTFVYGARILLVLGRLECQSEQERPMSKAIFASTEHTTNFLELSAEVALPWNHQWRMMASM